MLCFAVFESLFRSGGRVAGLCQLYHECPCGLPYLVFAGQWWLCGFSGSGCGLCRLAPDRYPDQNLYANRDSNADTHPDDDLHAQPNLYTDPKPDADSDGHLDEYPDCDLYAESHKYTDTQQDANRDKYADFHPDEYGYPYADLYTESNGDIYSYANLYIHRCTCATFCFFDRTLVDLGSW